MHIRPVTGTVFSNYHLSMFHSLYFMSFYTGQMVQDWRSCHSSDGHVYPDRYLAAAQSQLIMSGELNQKLNNCIL